jgi:crotonobetainyl-CoA:carnitine CoA-transferase CaiB-like acyl-CoA transferase
VYNRNKRSLSVDLSKDAGRDIVYRLIKTADVVVTNLRLYEREKFGLTYDILQKLNPRIIYGLITGHGMEGPDRDMPAYDTTVYFYRSGVNHILTTPGLIHPNSRPGFGDTIAGMNLAFGIMTALYARDKAGGTNVGQEVDTSLLFAGVYQLSFDMASALATGEDEIKYRLDRAFQGSDKEREKRDQLIADAQNAIQRLQDFYRERMPNPLANNYETLDGRQIRINALNPDRYWSKFCELIDHPELEKDPKFATMEDREKNCKELYSIFKKAFQSKRLEEWRSLMGHLPASPMQTLVEVMNDPQVKANHFFPDYDHPNYGRMKIMASPVNLSQTPAAIRHPAPELGQHTEEILLEAGYSWEDIQQFQAKGDERQL